MKRIVAISIAGGLMLALPAFAVTLGQIDTFEDGTTQSWVVNLLGLGVHPAPPVNLPDGGPTGAGDNFMQLTSFGGAGAGSRLSVINLAQWAGDYSTAGVTSIAMDVRNFGTTDLNLRLFLENPLGAPPTDAAVSSAIVLPAGGGWTHIEFAIDALSLTTLFGDVDTLLGNVTALRLFHGPDAAFPGPPSLALLGVDNIAAGAGTAIPEPSVSMLLGLGLMGLLVGERRRRRAVAGVNSDATSCRAR